jgi:glucose 1-dehydrogenase
MALAAQYAASKGSMEMLRKTMALEVANKGIRINEIAPGAIANVMNVDLLEDMKKMEEKENKIPMHRIGEPTEIANVAFFLASEAASYIFGTTIFVNGGLLWFPNLPLGSFRAMRSQPGTIPYRAPVTFIV